MATVAVVLLVAAAALAWWLLRERVVSLEVDGAPITNAQLVLDTADPVFRALAAADEATVPEGAGCWFAPAQSEGDGPWLACGPVALGVAGNSQEWVVGPVRYRSDGTGVLGEFDEFSGVANLAPGSLRRPDGEAPPEVDLTPPTGGVRTETGRRLTNLDRVLAQADADFLAVAAAQGVSTAEDSRCWVTTRVTGARRLADGSLACGPVRLTESEPDSPWTFFDLRIRDGDFIVDATVDPVDIRSVDATGPLPPGVTVYRPDADSPVDVTTDDLAVPDPPAQEPGFVEVYDLDDVTAETRSQVAALAAPADGRLRTPDVSFTLTGAGRTDRIGAPATALIAADGEELVVAAFTAETPPDAPGEAGASIVVDGVRSPLSDGARLPAQGLFVAAVPTDATSVDLEILSAERTHSLSLLTGQRPAEASDAAYRDEPTAGQAAAVTATVDLTGTEADPVTVDGVVSSTTVRGWVPEAGYAPEGQAFLVVTVDGWRITRPFVGATVDDITVTWRLAATQATEAGDADATEPEATAPAAAGTETIGPVPADDADEGLVFSIPVDATRVRLTAEITVTYDGGPTATATSDPATLDLPR